MNVGGAGLDAKVSSPPMPPQRVGGPIVVRGRESRPHGEGGQGSDVRQTNSWRSPGEVQVEPGYLGRSDERKPMTDRIGKSPLPGEPGALKGARPVRRGVWGNTVRLCALRLPYRLREARSLPHRLLRQRLS